MSDSPKSFDDVIGMLTHDCHVYALEVARLKAKVKTLRLQAVHDVSQLNKQSAENANLKAENEELHKDYEALADEHTKLIDRNAHLKAEVERLEKTEDYLQNTLNQYALDDMRLTAEVERLRKHDDDTCRHFIMRTLLEAQNGFLNARVERLRKAGDAMLALWEDTQSGHWAIDDAKPAWNAAKDGYPNGCLVNPSKVAQYLPKPPAAKEGKQS